MEKRRKIGVRIMKRGDEGGREEEIE